MNPLKQLFSRRRIYDDLSEEIREYLEETTEELIAGGMSRTEATTAARREFGNLSLVEEDSRDVWRWPSMENFVADIRYGLRMLRKNPGFTAVAVLTLALGIGANTAIFSYVNAWIIKPLPYPQSDRLMVFESHNKKKGWTREVLSSTASFLDFQKQNTSFEQSALWVGWNFNLTGDGPPALIEGGRVSWNYFDALGVKPMLGRAFTPDEDAPGTGHTAILGQGLWQSRYAGDRSIIGRKIAINGEPYTVVGVMAGTFQFPLMGLANLWTPLALTDQERADRSGSWLTAFGRLKPGVTPERAGAESAAVFATLETQFPDTNRDLTLLVSSMRDQIARKEGAPEVMICLCMVGLILLIACANVSNLMLARAITRTKEFALRGVLGATRGRLARQLMIESLLLFFFGGVGGALFGLWGMRWIDSQVPDHLRGYLVNYGHVDLDFTTLAFTLGIALLCGLVFGLAPARENLRQDPNRTIKEAAGQASSSKRGTRLRNTFVAAEIALAVLVLISTTLLVKSFINSVHFSPGYNPANVMVAQLALPKTKYAQESRQRSFIEDVLARIQALPQAASVAVASSVPFGGFGGWTEVDAADKPAPPPGERLRARHTAVSLNYFSAMQIELVRGRPFNSADAPGNSPSVVVNETLAREFWPDADPLGQQLRFGDQHTVCTIVGVVREIKMYTLRQRPERQMYVALAQFPSATLTFVVRTAANSTTMATAVRDAIWGVDRDQPISSVEPLETLMAVVNAGNLTLTKVVGFFGALAMFLGAIGIYGVVSDLVAQRTQEIGIRTALGATPSQVMALVIFHGLKLALVGVSVGVFCALGATRSLATMLYHVTPNDPLTFIAVPIGFAVVTAIACWAPARRAMRVDPIIALRYE
jgi:putative ABC transport system permease protein